MLNSICLCGLFKIISRIQMQDWILYNLISYIGPLLGETMMTMKITQTEKILKVEENVVNNDLTIT